MDSKANRLKVDIENVDNDESHKVGDTETNDVKFENYIEDSKIYKTHLKTKTINQNPTSMCKDKDEIINVDAKDLNIGFDHFKNETEILGFFDMPLPEDETESNENDLPKMEKLFESMEIQSLQESNIQNVQYINESENELESVYSKSDSENEMIIVPDFEIDYNNIFERVDKIGEIEKYLQLLYRPFTCHVDLNCRFSLYELTIVLDDASYEPANHPALFLRLRNPSAEVKLYAGGKIHSSALTAESAQTALLKVMRMVEELDYKTDIVYFSKNIVHASFSLPFKIDLEMLSEVHSENVSGNRETRPFITYKFDETAIRFAVFPNGYVLVLHSKQHSETRAAIAGLLPILAEFRNGYLTYSEKYGSLSGDISYKLLWERKLEEDEEGVLLYS